MTSACRVVPWWHSPADVGERIVEPRGPRDVVYVPWFWRYIMLIIRSIPEALFKRPQTLTRGRRQTDRLSYAINDKSVITGAAAGRPKSHGMAERGWVHQPDRHRQQAANCAAAAAASRGEDCPCRCVRSWCLAGRFSGAQTVVMLHAQIGGKRSEVSCVTIQTGTVHVLDVVKRYRVPLPCTYSSVDFSGG